MSFLDELQETMERMRTLMAQDKVRQSRVYFDILQMEPCSVCGQNVEYREGPPETFVMCEHVLARLKRACPMSKMNPTKPFDISPIGGFQVEVRQ